MSWDMSKRIDQAGRQRHFFQLYISTSWMPLRKITSLLQGVSVTGIKITNIKLQHIQSLSSSWNVHLVVNYNTSVHSVTDEWFEFCFMMQRAAPVLWARYKQQHAVPRLIPCAHVSSCLCETLYFNCTSAESLTSSLKNRIIIYCILVSNLFIVILRIWFTRA